MDILRLNCWGLRRSLNVTRNLVTALLIGSVVVGFVQGLSTRSASGVITSMSTVTSTYYSTRYGTTTSTQFTTTLATTLTQTKREGPYLDTSARVMWKETRYAMSLSRPEEPGIS
jgi:hypothetical protein